MRHGLAGAAAAVRLLQSHGGRAAGAPLSREQTVEVMSRHMRVLGLSPTELPPVIHIAGTKGKGSTAAMCEAILRCRGLTTGLYTSPHLVDVRERVRINGALADAEQFCDLFWGTWITLERVAEAGTTASPAPAGPGCEPPWPPPVSTLSRMPGFFQFLTLVALRVFVAARVDVAVIEVGLGGRLDATNAVPTDAVVVSGVAQLDYDHTELLGPTLADIAGEKAGIFRPGVPALTVPQPPEAEARLLAVARGVGAPLLRADEGGAVRGRWAAAGVGQTPRLQGGGEAAAAAPPLPPFPPLGLAGAYQRCNAALAVALTDVFLASDRGEAAARAAAAARGGTEGGDPGDVALLPRLREAVRGAVGAAAAAAIAASPAPRLLPYAPDVPLLPSTLAGLAAARWAGRAQAVPVTPDAAAGGAWRAVGGAAVLAPPVPAPTTVFLDGAHTGRSMRACAAWFHGASCASAGGGLPPFPPRRALVFYCGRDKAVLELLLPLAALDAWDAGVFFVSPALEKAAAAEPPTAPAASELSAAAAGAVGAADPGGGLPASALAALRECAEARHGPFSDASAAGGDHGPSELSLACARLLQQQQQQQQAAAGAGGGAAAGPVPWPAALLALWQELRRAGGGGPFERARAIEAAGLGVPLLSAAAAATAPVARVLPSADAALRALAALEAERAAAAAARGGLPAPQPLHVLVTGSLYLVGDALASLRCAFD